MANFTAKLDLHKEAHMTKNVADNEASAHVEAAKKGLMFCKDHPGMWISKPGMILGVKTRDCPLCIQESNDEVHGRDASSVPPIVFVLAIIAIAIGVFLFGKFNGRGVYTYADGGRYDGEWKDDKAYGRGVMAFANGDRYDGEWKYGMRSGRGVITFASGDRYDGVWKDDKINGRGVYTFVNGNRYDGEFKDDKYNGRGVITFANGDRYDGEFKDNKYNGRGVMTYADGRSPLKGIWENDNYKR
jgi:hypothetical protein